MKRESLILLLWILTFLVTMCISNKFLLVIPNAIWIITILFIFWYKRHNYKLKNWLETPLKNNNES